MSINAPAITGPALTVTSVGLDSQTLVQGETFDVESILNNISSVDSGTFTAEYVISADPTFATGLTVIGNPFTLASIAAGGTLKDIRSITLSNTSATGILYLGLIIDPTSSLALTNRSDAVGYTNVDVLPPADAFEPNPISNPTPVTLTNDLYTASHLNISPGDVDAFAVTFTNTAGPGDFISVQMTNPSEGQLVLSLLDTQGNVVMTTSDPTATLTLNINGLAAGSYIVEVTGATSFAVSSDYTLTIDPYLAAAALPGTISGGSTAGTPSTGNSSNGTNTSTTSTSGGTVTTTTTGTTTTTSGSTTTSQVASITQTDAQMRLTKPFNFGSRRSARLSRSPSPLSQPPLPATISAMPSSPASIRTGRPRPERFISPPMPSELPGLSILTRMIRRTLTSR